MEDDLKKKTVDANKSSDDEKRKEASKNEKSLEEKLKESEEKHLRALAEIENQRRRFEKEIKEAIEFGGFGFAKEALAVLDNFARAKNSINTDENLKDDKTKENILKNIEIIENDIITIFKKNSILKIDCLHKKFDPNYHQAMLEIEDVKFEPGTIIQEIQNGYMFKDRLLRPSLVGISKKTVENETENNEKK